MFNPNLQRSNFTQRYVLGLKDLTDPKTGVKKEIYVNWDVMNIGDQPETYRVSYQFEEKAQPVFWQASYQIDGVSTAPTNNLGPSPTRKRITEALGEEIILQPGQKITAFVEYRESAELDGSDQISFGAPTDGVIVAVTAPIDLEYVVDSMRPHTLEETATGKQWIFNERFEIEQHITLRWWPKA